jgi:hypothetical protein
LQMDRPSELSADRGQHCSHIISLPSAALEKEAPTMHYLVSADTTASDAFLSAVRKIGGKSFHPSCWFVFWTGTADSLALQLRNLGCGSIVVCRADEWSYR